ncbi:hypothetical protein NP493_605g01066 [Ridgeia piscesae]|uniref:Uncharacterized protein n=1 Tax=Ridgeia piscesae TaxID=27915 RepID=A0AAD9NNX4_RIDPI|nr:hypothetical protein NP493_605g01066 [Ridgeia piscesae]
MGAAGVHVVHSPLPEGEDRQRLEERRAAQREKQKTQEEGAKSKLQSSSAIFRLSSENLALAQRQASYESDKYPGTTATASPRSSVASGHAALVMSPHDNP